MRMEASHIDEASQPVCRPCLMRNQGRIFEVMVSAGKIFWMAQAAARKLIHACPLIQDPSNYQPSARCSEEFSKVFQ